MVELRGRIVGKPRQYKTADGQKRFATLLRLPNPDEFTQLGTVEVQSEESLGAADDVVKVKARVSGSTRPFQYTDRTSGEVKSGVDCTIRLTAV